MTNDYSLSLFCISSVCGCMYCRCGKSYFLVVLLRVIATRCRRILACAPSNKAVCVLLEQYLASGLPPRTAHRVVLVGVEEKLTSASDSISAGSGEPSSLSGYAAAATSSGRDRAPLTKETTPQRDRSMSRSSSLGSFDPAADLDGGEPFSDKLSEAARALFSPESAYDLFAYKIGERIGRVFAELSNNLKSELKHMSKLSPSDLRFYLYKFKHFIAEFTRVFNMTCDELRSLHNAWTVNKKHASVQQLLDSLEPLCSLSHLSYLENNRGALLKIAAEVNELAAVCRAPEAAAGMASEAISRAELVFCTLASSGQVNMRAFTDPDVLLVDEAAQALEPELCIPFLLRPQHAVLVGDPSQLSATLLSVRAQRQCRGDSTMKRLMTRCEAPFHLLSTQYRMHPEISQLPNRLFYEGKIADANGVLGRSHVLLAAGPLRSGEAGAPVPSWLDSYCFVDIEGAESLRNYAIKSSVSNVIEASLVARYLRAKPPSSAD